MSAKLILWIMVGLPASGKSTFASQYCKVHPNTIHVSRDEIRFSKITDDEAYFSAEREVFKEFCKQIQNNLNAGLDVIADATHLNWKSRSKLIRNLNLKNANINCIYVNTPVEVCIERNRTREGRACVPEDVIMTMNRSLTDPNTDPFIYHDIQLIT